MTPVIFTDAYRRLGHRISPHGTPEPHEAGPPVAVFLAAIDRAQRAADLDRPCATVNGSSARERLAEMRAHLEPYADQPSIPARVKFAAVRALVELDHLGVNVADVPGGS
jgi:hypothetical protein